MKSLTKWLILGIVLAVTLGGSSKARAEAIDLSQAVVVVPDGLSGPESKAVQLLVQEVRARTRINWDVKIRWPSAAVPVIAIGPSHMVDSFAGSYKQHVTSPPAEASKEGFQIRTIQGDAGAPVVLVIGNDARGVLFGAGRLLRELLMAPGECRCHTGWIWQPAPKYPLRGHQLGYRPKTNSYDGWDLAQWERYIRDLAVFGTNAIELIPPRSDDDADSPHFPLPPLEMMTGMSQALRRLRPRCLDLVSGDGRRLCGSQDRGICAQGVGRRSSRNCRRIDAVFVPGGDPGHTRPKVLMALLEKQAANLRRFHPHAQMWVSPQSFSRRHGWTSSSPWCEPSPRGWPASCMVRKCA